MLDFTDDRVRPPVGGATGPDTGAGEVASTEPPVTGVLVDIADGARRPTPGLVRTGALLRTVVAGLVDPGALTVQDAERRMLAAACAPQSGPRTVAVLSGKGGSGTTTTAAGIALTLAALRDDATALVDATASAGVPLGTRLTGRVSDHGRPVLTAAGLRVVDGLPWPEPGHDEEVTDVLRSLAARHTFTVLDVGNNAGDAALVNADQAVVVTSAGPRAVESTILALERIRYHIAERVDDTVVAVVCLRTAGHRAFLRSLDREIRAEVARIVVVPHDRALAGSARLDPAVLRPESRRAYLALAALVAGDR